ncbi:GCN5-related N-acetyltransferase [Methylocella silvestris BL2]|uniref:GCN5-related N-acetyltransferase n=1 Tax=Methylocella silvestris (strain DSM 15510 / CIP 108128 / LMG 27833 / NCIMB 13906 / BL2) TaxID=395965 RepID=B8ELI5_METSB|nr:GNAT family N-acetyltransferase [Methylocella silvestris]ACK49574.1 GCN5-related N-acetyltransferase [Methylocella silvestris BL2]
MALNNPRARIRPARAEDCTLILSLVAELADYEHLSAEMHAGEQDIFAALFGDAPRVFAAVAEWDGEAAGFALWFYTFSSFRGRHGVWLEDLYVRPAFRGKGCGKALLAHVARLCVAENLGRFEWSVLDWNEPSIRFYKSMGATLMDQWRICRVEDEALLRLGAGAPKP